MKHLKRCQPRICFVVDRRTVWPVVGGMMLWGVLLMVLHWLMTVDSFAYWMENDYCDRSVVPGTVIMGQEAVLSKDGFVRVFRGDTFQQEIESGVHLYESGEKFKVYSSIPEGSEGVEVIFEVNGTGKEAGFLAGGCGGRRAARDGSILMVPKFEDESEDGPTVLVWAGWATSYGQVKVTDIFQLLPATDNNIQIALMRAEGIIPPAKKPIHSSMNNNDKIEEQSKQEKENTDSTVLNRAQVISGNSLRGRIAAYSETGEITMWRGTPLLIVLSIIFLYYLGTKVIRLHERYYRKRNI